MKTEKRIKSWVHQTIGRVYENKSSTVDNEGGDMGMGMGMGKGKRTEPLREEDATADGLIERSIWHTWSSLVDYPQRPLPIFEQSPYDID